MRISKSPFRSKVEHCSLVPHKEIKCGRLPTSSRRLKHRIHDITKCDEMCAIPWIAGGWMAEEQV